MNARTILAIGATAFGLLTLAGVARADTLVLSCQVTNPGGSTACPASAPTYTVPGTYDYGNSFTSPDATQAIAGSNIDGASPGFIAAYFFGIAPASVDAVSSSIALGGVEAITGLFERIYSLSDNSGLVLGTLAGTVYNGAVSNLPPATLVQINPVTLTAGQYVLEISGTATGSAGGSYTGTLNLSPVPLPASLPLLLTGLLGFAGLTLSRPRNR